MTALLDIFALAGVYYILSFTFWFVFELLLYEAHEDRWDKAFAGGRSGARWVMVGYAIAFVIALTQLM